MFNENKNFKKKVSNFKHKLAISAPFIAPYSKTKKKIILLSIESMTDPQWLMKKFDLKFKTPSLDNLKVESESFLAQYHKLIVQGLCSFYFIWIIT